MRAVDTNVLLRVLLRDDEHQTAAAEDFIQDGAWVSVLALAEASWVAASIYRMHPDALATIIEMLLAHRHFILQDSDAIASALELFRETPALGFSDCLMIALAQKAGHLPLGTFDRRLAKVDGAHLLGGKSAGR